MLDKCLEKLYFDKRMIQWGLSQGLISHKDVEQHLSKLEDIKDKADFIQQPSTEKENTEEEEKKD